MKVGILTLHWAYNYGALLQAYALRKAVENLGHSVKFIDYAPRGKRLAWWQGWGLRTGVSMPANAQRRLRFDWFRRRHLPMTQRCRTENDMRLIAVDMDAVITGSDQVWNGNFFGLEPHYFLDFVDAQKCRRISYAACFGDPVQPDCNKTKIAELLKQIDSLSVRNAMSSKLVHEIAQRGAHTVLDPTLLHNFDGILPANSSSEKYIVAYFLDRSMTSCARAMFDLLKKRLGLPIVLIDSSQEGFGDVTCVRSAGPMQWLKLFKEASFVVTDSFHGTVFSVKFNKPFISLRGHRPERLHDFLKICGLESRLISSVNPSVIDDLTESQIDFESVNARLVPYIINSHDFLKGSLSG